MSPRIPVPTLDRLRACPLFLLAWLGLAWLGLDRPAEAASMPTRADFDADGLLDTAIVHQSANSTQIEVRLSGSAGPVFLSPSAPVVALRSTDVTGDGVMDLVADSPGGLRVWVYAGRMLPVNHAAAITASRTPTIDVPAPSAVDEDASCCDPRPSPLIASIPLVHDVTAAGAPARHTSAGALGAPGTQTTPRAPPLA
jgi:hypothetical protein